SGFAVVPVKAVASQVPLWANSSNQIGSGDSAATTIPRPSGVEATKEAPPVGPRISYVPARTNGSLAGSPGNSTSTRPSVRACSTTRFPSLLVWTYTGATSPDASVRPDPSQTRTGGRWGT